MMFKMLSEVGTQSLDLLNAVRHLLLKWEQMCNLSNQMILFGPLMGE